jgi:hypothetical protein
MLDPGAVLPPVCWAAASLPAGFDVCEDCGGFCASPCAAMAIESTIAATRLKPEMPRLSRFLRHDATSLVKFVSLYRTAG